MDITPYVNEMAASLRVALSADTDSAQAERLAAAVQAPARLAIMGAVSQAAAEATSTLPAGRIGVQLAGPELVLAYEPGATPIGSAPPQGSAKTSENGAEEDDNNQARLTLRLPASVKAKAEKAAADQGVSLNAWVVRALADATANDFDLRIGPVGVRMGNSGNTSVKGWV
jgi:hypothetical protein